MNAADTLRRNLASEIKTKGSQLTISLTGATFWGVLGDMPDATTEIEMQGPFNPANLTYYKFLSPDAAPAEGMLCAVGSEQYKIVTCKPKFAGNEVAYYRWTLLSATAAESV